MKILTILGARPQFIKAGSVSREIAKYKAKITGIWINKIIILENGLILFFLYISKWWRSKPLHKKLTFSREILWESTSSDKNDSFLLMIIVP